MQFSSPIFLLLFLPLTMGVYKVVGRFCAFRYKNAILLASSLFFYSWGEPLFVLVLIVGVCLNFGFGLWIDRESDIRRKIVLIVSLIYNLGILLVFKYLSFITRELSRIIPISALKIALPVGISFYTFQIMSYIFDVYYRKVPAQKNVVNLALYVSMFPQLVAGPIVRYSDVEYMIHNRIESKEAFYRGTHRFIIGLSKKILIADYLGGIVDKIFVTAEFDKISMMTAWVGALAYTFQIYYDFSGYSDMAIGLGDCFGFQFKENFRYPYTACSITDFWKRWHISLTDWFRDYVYIPMGGNRVSQMRHIYNLFIVWLLTGIWHGAEWTFLIWGMMHFGAQLIEKKWLVERSPSLMRRFLTMLFVTFGWVVFRASNVQNALDYISTMVGLGDKKGLVDNNGLLYLESALVVFVISFIGTLPIKIIIDKLKNSTLIYIIEGLQSLAIVFLLGVCLMIVINGSYSPFIYFNF